MIDGFDTDRLVSEEQILGFEVQSARSACREGAMSYESTAEPIKIGYLMDFRLPDSYPQQMKDDFSLPFELVFGDALEQGVIDRGILRGTASGRATSWNDPRSQSTRSASPATAAG